VLNKPSNVVNSALFSSKYGVCVFSYTRVETRSSVLGSRHRGSSETRIMHIRRPRRHIGANLQEGSINVRQHGQRLVGRYNVASEASD